ncbi:MAG: ATP-dependent helicase, partial [Fidelibacterota bacterium]
PVGAVTGSFIPFFNRIRDELLMPEEVAGFSEKLNLSEETVPDQFPGLSDKTEPQEYLRQFHDLVKVYETYQSWKKDLGVVDYSDMVVACWEMLSNDKEVLETVRQRFRHIVVDEYQDNNYALNQVMGLLAGDRADITVVGDEDQCIYTFRGANYYNVHDFKRRYGVSPGNGEIWLEENHRSTQEILDLANATMEADSYRTPKKLISAWGRRGPKPVWHVGNRKQALEEIPILVDQLVDKGYGYGEVAVLCRTWNQARNVAGSLERAFIPVDIPEEHFFDTGLVKDVLAWGNLLYDHTRANDALFRLLSRYLGRSFAEEFFRSQEESTVPERLARLSSLAESETVDGRRKETLSWILNTLSSLKRKVKQRRRVDEMIWEILEAADLLKATRHSYRHPERLALAAAGRLLSMAEEFVAREGGSDGELDRWLRYMDVLSLGPSPPPLPSEGVQKPNPLAVKVMTIHASKGLEFPVVIIPFLESGSLPLRYTPSPRIDVLPESWYRW